MLGALSNIRSAERLSNLLVSGLSNRSAPLRTAMPKMSERRRVHQWRTTNYSHGEKSLSRGENALTLTGEKPPTVGLLSEEMHAAPRDRYYRSREYSRKP